MPIGGAQEPQVDLDKINEGAANLSVDPGVVYSRAFQAATDPGPQLSMVGHVASAAGRWAAWSVLPGAPDPNSDKWPGMLSADEANDKYGTEGLRFNAPISENEAAYKQHMAIERQADGVINASSNANPLLTMGASMAGGLANPTNWPLIIATDGWGEGALGLAGITDLAPAVTKVGKIANVVGKAAFEGTVTNAPFVGQSYLTEHYMGAPYDAGDALKDIALGAVMHTGVHTLTRGAGIILGEGRKTPATPDIKDVKASASALAASASPGTPMPDGPTEFPPPPPPGPSPFADVLGLGPMSTDKDAPTLFPNPVPAEGVPPEVDALPGQSRLGGFGKTIDDFAGDRTVTTGEHVVREANPPGLPYLDEASGVSAVPSFRPREADTAVTALGTEFPVTYGLVELGDLTTSHHDDLTTNAAYPPELQNRGHERPNALAESFHAEAGLDPKRLTSAADAGGGAPVISTEGVVESNNAAAVALRRSAAEGGEAYAKYRAALEAQGFDTAGMQAPVLVRMRNEPMTGAQRSGLVREMSTETAAGVTAQAMADARAMDRPTLDALQSGDEATRRAGAKQFFQRAAPEAYDDLVNENGSLSKAGSERLDAALMARAYGDPALVRDVIESPHPALKSIGRALKEAAPDWIRMREAAARGDIPADADPTEALLSAVDLIRQAKDMNMTMGEWLKTQLDITEPFGEGPLGATTEMITRLLHRDTELTKPLGVDAMKAALKDFTDRAMKARPSEDGAGPREDTARQLLGNLADRIARKEGVTTDLRPPGRAAEPDAGAEPPSIDLRRPGEAGGGDGRGPPSDAGGAGAGEGGVGSGDAGAAPKRLTGSQMIAADPELKAMDALTNEKAAENGLVLPEVPAARNPDTVAEAIRAAAVCVLEEGI